MLPPSESPSNASWAEPLTWTESVTVSDAAAAAATEAATLIEPIAGMQVILGEVPEIDADWDVLYDVVIGMLWNAALAFDRAEPERNAIFLATSATDTHVVIEVAHNGRSLSAADCVRALRPHYRRRHQTGLELCGIQRMVDEYGGKVVIHSAVGRGCRIEVSLPL